MNSAFLLITEPGPLEAEAMLLAASIREFGGAWAQVPIVSFQPRAGADLAQRTLTVFKQLGVEHRRELLNTEFIDYPVANKALSAAFAAKNLGFDSLVMWDSDKALLAEPKQLALSAEEPIALRPVHQKLSGTTGKDDNASHWRALYEQFGLQARHRVRTTMHGESIWGYWNSGLVAATVNSGLFAAWCEHLLALLRGQHLASPHAYFADQFALALAVDEVGSAVRVLPPNYNYPVAFQRSFSAGGSSLAWSELVTIHYHKMFYRPTLRHPLAPFMSGRPHGSLSWFLKALDQSGVYPRGLAVSASRKLQAAQQRWARK